MHALSFNLLGRPEVRLDDGPLTGLATTKVEALLYYLACRPGPNPREELAGLLWGETSDAKARRSLTQALSSLRKLTGDLFVVDRLSVGLDEAALSRLDVAVFETVVTAEEPAANVAQLGEAVALYRGDFLEGLYVKDAPAFEEWQLGQRERLRLLMLAALERLVAAYVDRLELDVAAGLAYGRRLLVLDPWREAAHRQMMRLLARSGQRSAALAQYESCRRVLAEELGVEPTRETTALYERLLAAGKAPPHNLPASPSTFVGRESELAQIADHLANPDCRLLTIVGPGGIGKTRMALEAARRYTGANVYLDDVAFADGVFFASLAPLAETSSQPEPQMAHRLVSAVGEALDISFQGPAELTTQLLNYLRSKKMLLLLDNFESLLAPAENGAGVVLNILQSAPGVKLLVTSRERVNVREEWAFAVDGLEYPGRELEGPEGEPEVSSIPGLAGTDGRLPDPRPVESFSAIGLFVQRAQQAQRDFNISDETLADIIRICRLVGGAPLALELAASWSAVLSCREIAREIEQSLDFLESSLRNVPQRHRSIRVVFEQSRRMLTPAEQAVFCRLSVFRGGFEREAAGEVAGASLPILTGLVNKSLLRLVPSGRYEVHELLRQFAVEKLRQQITEEGDEQMFYRVGERHSRYFLRLIAGQEAALHGSQPQQAAAELRLELDNIRQAWRWAVTYKQLADLEDSIEAMVTFYELSGFFEEGEEIFGSAAAVFRQGASAAGDSQPDIICHLLTKQAWFASLLGNYERAKGILEAVLHLAGQAGYDPLRRAEAQAVLGQAMVFGGEMNEAIAQLRPAMITYRTLNRPRQLAFTLAWLGEAYARTQKFDAALAALEEALELDRLLENKRGQAFDYGAIASVYSYRDMPETALTYQQNALALYKELAYPFGLSGILNNMGLAYYHLGRYSEALSALKQALEIYRQLSNEWDEANTLENLGAVYTALGDYEQAQQCLERALDLFGGSKMGEAYVVYRLGQLYLERGDYEESQAHLRRAMALGEAMDDRKLVAACTGELGVIDHREKRFDQALARYRQAIGRLKGVGARFDTAKFSVAQARLLYEQGEFEQAQTTVAEGIELAQKAGHGQILFEGQLLQARIAFARGETAAARQQLQDLMATSTDEAKRAALTHELRKMDQGRL